MEKFIWSQVPHVHLNLLFRWRVQKEIGQDDLGHMTGQVDSAGQAGFTASKGRKPTTQCFNVFSWRYDILAKLNLKCHMNFLIIFTQINFSLETSIKRQF